MTSLDCEDGIVNKCFHDIFTFIAESNRIKLRSERRFAEHEPFYLRCLEDLGKTNNGEIDQYGLRDQALNDSPSKWRLHRMRLFVS
jgi:hypothetical protein